MLLIYKYVLRAHIGPFIFGTVVVMFLFLFQFLLKYIDELVGKGLDAWVIIQLIVLNTAWMLVLAVPMGVLFATLMAFGGMSAAQEVTIIKASGISLVRMMIPVIIVGGMLTYFIYWFNDAVLPDANHKAKILMNDIMRKKPTFSIEAGKFSTQIEGYTILAREVDSLNGTLKGVTIYDKTKRYRLNIVDADTGIIRFNANYTGLIINLYNGEIHQSMPEVQTNYRIIKFASYQITIKTDEFSFQRSSEGMFSRGDRELRIKDMRILRDTAKSRSDLAESRINQEFNNNFLYLTNKLPANGSITRGMLPEPPNAAINNKFITDSSLILGKLQEQPETSKTVIIQNLDKRMNFLRSSLYSDIAQAHDGIVQADKYQVEIDKKFAIPFACLLFLFVGCPLGIMTRGGNFGLSAAISLVFYIFYWACLIGGEKLADRAIISPFLSMWIGNIVIGLMGIILTMRVNNESFRFRFTKKKNVKVVEVKESDQHG